MDTDRTHKNESHYTGFCRSCGAGGGEVHVSQVKCLCRVFMLITKKMCSSSKVNHHIASGNNISPINN